VIHIRRNQHPVRQVVNRHLQHWRKQGTVDKHKYCTEIAELEALQHYANEVETKIKKKDKVSSIK